MKNNIHNRKQIFLSAGTEYYLGNRIANSGENCGFDYSVRSSSLSVYINKPIDIPLDLSIKIIEFIKQSEHKEDFEMWKACGDETPEFTFSETASVHICNILNFHLATNLEFIPQYLDVTSRKLIRNSQGINEWENIVDTLFKLNDIARNVIRSNMDKSLKYAKNLQWPFFDIKVPKEINTTYQRDPYVPFPVENQQIEIMAGYTYPFDLFMPISPKKHRCICHKPIFTIFSSHRLPLSFTIADQLNNIIDILSKDNTYEEIGTLGKIKYRFKHEQKLTDFILQFLRIAYKNKYIFVGGNFCPEKSISYLDSYGLKRRYHNCVNINAQVYEHFSRLLYADDTLLVDMCSYPVDKLIPIHKYNGYGSWEYSQFNV